MSSTASEPTETLAAALGRIPSGLFVLTVKHRHHETGLLASWVQQCSLDPPHVSVAIRKGRDILDWLEDGSSFVLNIIPEGGKTLIAHFGKGFDRGQKAFEGLEVSRDREAAPVLLASHAYLACRVASHTDAGDHVVLIARVTSGAVLCEGKPTVHVRKNGMKY